MLYEIESHLLEGHLSRGEHRPILIVNHITDGSFGSVVNTFSNLANKKSSTYLNGRAGRIMQFVDLKQVPRTNGNIRNPTSPVVKQIGSLNPNYYTVSIENEGYDGNGVDGTLTEEQFWRLCWLHKWIQTEVKRIYGNKIPLNSTQVIGHNQIDAVGKALCPGMNFPWGRLYPELAIADGMELEAYEERLLSLQGDSSKRSTAYAIAERVNDLGERLTDVRWGVEASRKLELLYPILDIVTGEKTPVGVVERVKSLYKTALGNGTFSPEGIRKLLLFEPIMRDKGII